MAQANSIFNVSPPPPLKLKDNKSEEWKLFRQLWENYTVITELAKKDKKYQRAVFLNTIGTEGLRLFNTLTFKVLDGDRREDEYDIDLIISKIDAVIVGETNETYERYIFNRREQVAQESVEEYVTALRDLSRSCNFCDCLHESLIRDRLVLGIKDQGTRKLLLQKKKLTLAQAVEICRSAEATTRQLRDIGEDPTIHAMRPTKFRQERKSSKMNNKASGASSKVTDTSKQVKDKTVLCKFCGRTHAMSRGECPAYGKTCNVCKKRNHFANCCNKKPQVRMVGQDESDDTETESVDAVESVNAVSHQKGIYAEMLIEDTPCKFQVDCGATVNVIPHKYVPASCKIELGRAELKTYNKSSVWAMGSTVLKLRNPKTRKKYRTKFMVIEEAHLTPLISRKTSEWMGLITVNYDNLKIIQSVSGPDDPMITEFEDVFDDKSPGKLPGIVSLEVETEARPIQCGVKAIPVSLKDRVKSELQNLVTQEILAPVDKPTDWCSRLVITEKKNSDELRFCIDPRPLNKVLKREMHRLPVIEDILPELSKARVFSKLDLKSGYLHCELDDQSSHLTTMNTPFGRYRWKRLPFGLSVSSEIFQKKLQQAIAGLEGVECVADDIIVFGAGDTKEEAMKNHDKHLRALLLRCREKNIRLNRRKSILRTESVVFLGHIISERGLEADPQKIEAILQLPKPTNKTEVQRLQGSVQYLAKFLPHLSEVFEPLRKLTHKDQAWLWGEEQDNALKEIKNLLTSAPILSFYDPSKELVIQCDASKSGLGATLLQEGRPVAYASRALTQTEQRYAQIEKEALAIVFALERFHQYTFGRHITVQSDHKPLESIVKKPLHSAPRRLQGMMMRMLHYDIEIHWTKGKDMHIADLLSRAYLPDTTGTTDFADVSAISYTGMSDGQIQDLKTHTSQDETLQELKSVILEGWPEQKSNVPPRTSTYFHVRDELSVQDGLIYRGERVVIPISMRKKILEQLHSSHLGTESTLRRARDCIFWPGMNTDIKLMIATCDACRTYESNNQKETLQPHELPDRPFEKVAADLFELEGKHYLITVDYFSNFWEIDRLHDLSSRAVIKKLKAHFSRYGIPNVFISDNGPQFVSEDFVKFKKAWDFDHITISPRHSQANGKVESAVKAAKRMMRKCTRSHSDQYKAMLEIRNTPTQGLNTSPAQRLHGRRTRTNLPTTKTLLEPAGTSSRRYEKQRMEELQRKQQQHYNKGAKDLPGLEEGDIVRVKPYKVGDSVWQKAVVKRRLDDRSYHIEREDGIQLRRNRRDLKHTNEDLNEKVREQEEVVIERQETQYRNTKHVTKEKRDTQNTKHHDKSHTQMNHTNVEITNNTQPESSLKKTRAGRVVRPPDRYRDYVQK